MQGRNEVQVEFLEKCVKEYRIFIDTCSLLQEGTEKFFSNIVPILWREKKSLIMPLSVYKELEKIAGSYNYCRQKYSSNPNLYDLANRSFGNVKRMVDAELIKIYADKDDGNFADNVFLKVITGKRMQFDILLITQDVELAKEVLNLGRSSGAVRVPYKVVVEKINADGFLEKIFWSKEKPVPPDSSEKIPANERFKLSNEIVNIEGNLPVTSVPKVGDWVTSIRVGERKIVHLVEEIGSGGEGSVYKTNLEGLSVKIYKPEKITRLRFEKLKLMLTKDIECEGVCFPLALIYNQRNEFVGYLMKTARGRDLGKSVFMPALLKKIFPSWTRIDTVQLCVTILKKLKYLHDRNIILGDINPYNILVVSPTEVYFVDTDSWQVEGFICPVGMPLFTAPELQKKSSYGLRTLGNENFAVATLLFMIMHPGKPPYSMQDGEGIVENIIRGDFSYPFGEQKTGKAPNGPWRYCWSHLLYKVKEAFYETFRYNGKFHDENNRRNAGWWLRLFEYYLELMKTGKMKDQDEESLLIFPTRFKHQRDKVYSKCKFCGKEFDSETLVNGACPKCVKKNEIYVWRTCKECGERFSITVGEKEFFDKKGFDLPMRCKDCR